MILTELSFYVCIFQRPQTSMWTVFNPIRTSLIIWICIYEVKACIEKAIKEEIMGYICPESDSAFHNTSSIVAKECVLQCIYRPECVLAVFNAREHCILFSSLCTVAQHDEESTMIPLPNYHIPHQECLRWIPFAGAWPTGRVVVHEDAPNTPQLLARGNIGSAVVIGKLYRKTLQLWTVYEGNGKRITNKIEYFDIHPTCFGRWVTFRGGLGRDLPSGAVKGGTLTNGIPLYVVKAQHQGGDHASLGYYNSELDRAVITVGGEEIHEEMEILVVN